MKLTLATSAVCRSIRPILTGMMTLGSHSLCGAAEIHVDAADVKTSLSPWLYGSCIEDVNHEIYGGLYDQRLYGESFEESAPAAGIFGWSPFGGSWSPGSSMVSVGENFGAKLVKDLPRFLDGAVEFDVRFTTPGDGGRNAGAIVRVNNPGVGADAFDGYEVSLSADGGQLLLGRHQQNWAFLASGAVSVDPAQWQHVRVVMTGARIQVYLNGAASPVIDHVDANPLPAGSMGLRTWGSNAEFRNFKTIVAGQESTAGFDAVSRSITGWPAYGGQWQPDGAMVSVLPNLGAKLVRSEPRFSDGSVDFDVRIASPSDGEHNAGAILRVRNSGVGPDTFDGYEVSLISNGSRIILGKHKQNFTFLQQADIAVDATQWQHVRVVLTGARIQVYLNGSSTAVIDHVDSDPLPSGSMGLRTWGSNAQFRNFSSVSAGVTVAGNFVGVAPVDVSAVWDPVVTGAAQAVFTVDRTQAYNGQQSQKIQHTGGAGSVGVSNQGLNRWGIAVKAGSTYGGRVYLRSSGLSGPVSVKLQSADGAQTYATQTIQNVPASWTKFPLSLTSSANDANARFVVSIDSPGSVWVDQSVLLEPPDAKYQGVPVRPDIAHSMTDGKLTFLRYGGTAVNSPNYRWKQMIGDPDLRPQYNGHWHPHTTNGFGIEEFVAFCEKAGIEPSFAINAEETPQDMADMIEYLNGAATSTWGAVRAANGHPAPYGVKYIQIGNEEVIWGDIAGDYDHYIARFKLLAAAMKQVDPNLVLINAAWWRGNNANCERVFKELEGIADYWDFHFWADDANSGVMVDQELALAKQLFQQWVPGAKMKVVIFEENGNRHDVQRALGHATLLNAVRKHGDFVLIDCEANGLQPWLQNDNGWDQGHVFFTPGQVWGMPPYYAQQMASANHLPLLVGSQVQGTGDLNVSTTKSEDGKTICFHVVNTSQAALATRITLANFPDMSPAGRTWTLSGQPGDRNTPEAPTAFVPGEAGITNASNDFNVTFPPFSYTVLRVNRGVNSSAIQRAIEYANQHGLQGTDALPDHDADGDGVSNFGEWAFGTHPGRPDSNAAGARLGFTDLSAQGFLFNHRRLSDHQTAGVNYRYEVSDDLRQWRVVTPVEISSQTLSGSPGYESAAFRLPGQEVQGHGRLFLRIVSPH